MEVTSIMGVHARHSLIVGDVRNIQLYGRVVKQI